MARIAQGNMAMLFPTGVRVNEVPSDFVVAVTHANTILSWFEHLRKEEVPPEWMWPFPDELKEWFDEIEEIRRQDGPGGDEIVDMETNEYAANLK